jgi:hypothetical protein
LLKKTHSFCIDYIPPGFEMESKEFEVENGWLTTKLDLVGGQMD